MPKLIEGHRIKAKDLLHYFKVYMKVFNGSELPEPKSILEVIELYLSIVVLKHETFEA